MHLLKQKKLLFKIILFTALFFIIPYISQADGLVPCGGPSEKPCTVNDIFIIIARVTNWLISVAGIYLVYLIVNHGFWLIASMGNEEAITTRKKALSNAVVGFALVMFAFMFINTAVNFILGPGLFKRLDPDPKCNLDLTNPLTYLTIDPNKCSSIAPQK